MEGRLRFQISPAGVVDLFLVPQTIGISFVNINLKTTGISNNC